MKIFTGIGAVLALLAAATFAQAASLNPGWYMGAFGGGGSMGSLNFPHSTLLFTSTNDTFIFNRSSGTKSFGLLGDLGIDFGYRYCNFRVEGAVLFGGSSVKDIKLNGFSTIFIPPSGVTVVLPPDTYNSSTDYIAFNGPNTNLRFVDTQVYYAGFLNLLYDFYPDNVEVSFVPYVGIGIGYIHINDTFNIDYQDFTGYPIVPTFNYGLSFNTVITAPVAQGILGALFLVDDFSSVGADFRYMVSGPLSNFEDGRLKIYTLNLVFNYTFDTA